MQVARCTEEALDQAAADPPDVALLDVMMPGPDGCELARALRARAGGAKRPLLVAVTGCGSAADRDRTHAAGFDLHLVKPVAPALLMGLLERFRRVLAPAVPVDDREPHDPHEEPPDPSASGLSRRRDRRPLVLSLMPTRILPSDPLPRGRR